MPIPAAVVGAGIMAAGGVLGGILGNRAQIEAAEKNTAYQREFAQHGIRWKTADARAAGLHPLAALGAQTTSYQSQPFTDQVGPAISSAGQSIGKAYARTQETKLSDIDKQNIALDLEYKRYRNDNLLLENMGQNAQMSGVLNEKSANPTVQNDLYGLGPQPDASKLIEFQPRKVTATDDLGREPGMQPIFGPGVLPGGFFVDMLGQMSSEALENDGFNKWKITLYRAIQEMKRDPGPKPKVPLPTGYIWVKHKGWNWWKITKLTDAIPGATYRGKKRARPTKKKYWGQQPTYNHQLDIGGS